MGKWIIRVQLNGKTTTVHFSCEYDSIWSLEHIVIGIGIYSHLAQDSTLDRKYIIDPIS